MTRILRNGVLGVVLERKGEENIPSARERKTELGNRGKENKPSFGMISSNVQVKAHQALLSGNIKVQGTWLVLVVFEA